MRFVVVAALFHCLCLSLVERAAAESQRVTCGSTIKLQHVRTQYRLHSHNLPYGSGSGQQSVTGYPSGDDPNSFWVVRANEDGECAQGAPISNNQKIRLQHSSTRRWLHSHLHTSPLSRNQEVSAFGSDDETDTGDVWIIEWDGRAKFWEKDSPVRFQHVDTGMYLISHERRYSNPIPGQQEVCAIQKKKDKNTQWTAAEGVYFSDGSGSVHDEL